jgi:VanZ family protein
VNKPRILDLPDKLLNADTVRVHWRRLLLMLVVIVAWLSFAPASGQQTFDHADKLAHAAAFFALGAAAALSWSHSRRVTQRAALALLAYGALIEAVQSMLPSRSADGLDFLADAAGVALGLWVVHALRVRWPPGRD